MVEAPALSIPHPGLNIRISATEVHQAFSAMTSQQQARYLSLSDSARQDVSDKLHRIFYNNAIVVGAHQQFNRYLDFSMINHACVPNSICGERKEIGNYMVIAMRPILKGEEITISYQGNFVYYTAAQRAFLTNKIWSFTCDCKGCKHGPALIQASDMRRVMLAATFEISERGDSARKDAVQPVADPLAVCAINSKPLYQIDLSHTNKFTEEDYTFIWFLQGQLIEAEGLFGHNLGITYQRACNSLQTRLIMAGRTGKRVDHLEACFRKIKLWWQMWFDIERVISRPAAHPVWGAGEQQASRRRLPNGYVAYTGYDKEGTSSLVALPEKHLKELEAVGQTGNEFCDEYKKKFGHLY